MNSIQPTLDHAHKKHDPNSGYVLLVVVVIIALAAIVLASISRLSLAIAVESKNAAAELQDRWMTLSCQRNILPAAARILDKSVILSDTSKFQLEANFEWQAAGKTYRCRIADEAAKMNVQTLMASSENVSYFEVLRRTRLPLAIRVAPGNRKRNSAKEIESWGAIVVPASSSQAPHLPASIQSISRRLTIDSPGKLNTTRASDRSLQQISSLAVQSDMVAELLDKRRKLKEANVKITVNALVRELEASDEEITQLRQLLTDESRCYSMWLERSTSGISHFTYSLLDRTIAGQPRKKHHAW